MAKSPKESKTDKIKPVEIQLEPDAWPRFERFIKQAAKAGPQPRKKTTKANPKRKTPAK
jgi:hypothetical protein